MSEKKVNYLRIDKFGTMYTVVPEGTPNATKLEFDNGNVQYRVERKYGTIRGKITNVFIKEVTFITGKVKMLYIFLEGDTEVDCLSFQLFNSNGSMNSYVKSAALGLSQTNFDEEVYINADKKKNKKGFTNKNLYFTYVNGNEWIRMSKEEFDKIPPPAVKTRADGVKTYDFTEQDTYYYQMLTKVIEENFKTDDRTEQNVKQEAPLNPPPQPPTNSKVNNTEEDDDLPF